jgi:error-prone DNA polymerase
MMRAMPSPAPRYAELQVTTNFSFLRGASHPHELVLRAAELGHHAIAVTDWNSVAGLVRAHLAARELGMRLIPGCRLSFTDGTPDLLCYPQDRAAYGRLCRMLSRGKLAAAKGECRLTWQNFLEYSEGQIVAVIPPEDEPLAPGSKAHSDFRRHLARIAGDVTGRAYLAASHRFRGDDAKRLHRLAALARETGLPLVATNDVLYHTPERRRLQDVLTCIRDTVTIDDAGFRLERNAERHLKSPVEMARLFASHPDAIANTVELAERCRFSLEELRYEYPDEIAPDGEDPQARLERLTWDGLKRRYPRHKFPEGPPQAVVEQIGREFELIARRQYAPFFLTVEDIVRFARQEGILHQGRGSAANSAVCYALGITEVDPARSNLLFERFISDARDEPPDIDVDFEHERREEVIQYVYRRFGRHRAGLCATVICYRTRGAVREVGKALGLSPDVTAALSGSVWGWSEDGIDPARLAELGLDARDARLQLCLDLSRQLIGFPRHLSQHPGGFLITRGRLDELCTIENAAMEERTIISWDKDDIESLGMLKVDVLALGMLTCLAKGFALLREHFNLDLSPATIPAEDAAVYEMISRADTIGVFQIESRAQQTMLPRLKPKTFYDLVVEVAIVRPGPIQGQMVHPYLRRRQGLEPVTYPSEELRRILEKTLGVPLFQEQCMQIAITAAGFRPSRADELRRAMATFRKVGTIHTFREEFINGMIARNYDREFAERCFSQIQGFGTYGFPESHAASFALLVYCSSWMKCYYPEVFCCAILNSQPMGFYAPAQLVRDAREHGVEVRPVDVNFSDWDHKLEAREEGGFALRLGFRIVAGMRETDGRAIAAARGGRESFSSAADVMQRAGLGVPVMLTLARADAFGSLAKGRRESLWDISGLDADALPLFGALETSPAPPDEIALPAILPEQTVAEDYAVFGLSLQNHPMSFVRKDLDMQKAVRACDLKSIPDGKFIRIAGLVLFRQRPGTAKGTIFITIEDETGAANLIVWPKLSEKYRRAVFGAKVLICDGILQREQNVIHVVSRRLVDWTAALRRLRPDETSFALRFGRGDEVSHGSGGRDPRQSPKRPPASWTDGLKPRELSWTNALKSRDFR